MAFHFVVAFTIAALRSLAPAYKIGLTFLGRGAGIKDTLGVNSIYDFSLFFLFVASFFFFLSCFSSFIVRSSGEVKVSLLESGR